jgi:hypothetical protein
MTYPFSEVWSEVRGANEAGSIEEKVPGKEKVLLILGFPLFFFQSFPLATKIIFKFLLE